MRSPTRASANAAVVRHDDFPKVCPRLDAAWIKYLVVTGRDNAAIRARLEADDLPTATDEELDSYRIEVVVPPNFDPTSSTHLASRAFIERHHLEVLFRPNATQADAALVLLRARRPRELVEAGLLTGVPLAAIVHILRERLCFRATVVTLQHYARLFFYPDDLSRALLRSQVEQRVQAALTRLGGCGDPKAIRRTVNADARVVAASMPSSKLSWAAVMLAFGWPPPPQDLASSIGELATIACVRAHEAAARGGRDDDRRALAFAAVVEKVQSIRGNLGAPMANIREALQVHLLEPESAVTVAELLERGDQVGTAEPCPANDDEAEAILAPEELARREH